MSEPSYRIGTQVFRASDPGLGAALESIHATAERPLCMCVPAGVPMYVARHERLVVKRMPETGPDHRVDCVSYEPPPGTSGLGQLMGDAVVPTTGEDVEVRCDFALSRSKGKAVQRSAPQEGAPAEIKASRKGLSLRGLLHLLYERAGFNRWTPRMAGKRNQAVFQWHMLEAAKHIVVKGAPLSERLHVPGRFSVERKDELARARREKLRFLSVPGENGQTQMALILGEYNGSEPGDFGRRLAIRHMPDAPLLMDDKMWAKTKVSYEAFLSAREADVAERPRLLMLALVSAKQDGVYQIVALTMMLVSAQFIPMELQYEQALIDALVLGNRNFVKPLRYESKSAGSFANAILLDAGPEPVALHLVSEFNSDEFAAAKAKAIHDATTAVWTWDVAEPMPELPPVVSKARIE